MIPDNYDLWEARQRRLDEALERLPVCAECGCPIQQELAVRIGGKWYCDPCMTNFREEVTMDG